MLPAFLECSDEPAHRFEAERLATVCPHDGAPLLVRYARAELKRDAVLGGPATMWRYREMLPVDATEALVSLGEGATPLLRAERLERELRLGRPLFIKDESQNPTGSFKARGMSVAVTRAKRLGATELTAPSAGNAGGALAAYGARAALPVTIFLPRDTPDVLVDECRSYGARVELVDGLIDECGARAAAFAQASGAFNVATLREPYRIEGKKTMAYELVESLGGVPGTIVYPMGGGTGLIAMWKGFDELEAAGWIGSNRPMMVGVQAAGCAPIVRAFEAGAERAERWADAATAAWGLRVPVALGDRLMLCAIRESGGTALAVGESELRDDMSVLRECEGIDAGEEGGATLAALRLLLARGKRFTGPIVIFNTGSALKYGSRTALPGEAAGLPRRTNSR